MKLSRMNSTLINHEFEQVQDTRLPQRSDFESKSICPVEEADLSGMTFLEEGEISVGDRQEGGSENIDRNETFTRHVRVKKSGSVL